MIHRGGSGFLDRWDHSRSLHGIDSSLQREEIALTCDARSVGSMIKRVEKLVTELGLVWGSGRQLFEQQFVSLSRRRRSRKECQQQDNALEAERRSAPDRGGGNEKLNTSILTEIR